MPALHLRAQLRAAVVAALTGTTSCAANVFAERDWPMEEAHFPALLVWDTGGNSRPEAMADSDAEVPLERSEDLVVEIAVLRVGGEHAAPKMQDALDAIAAEVEVIMMSDAVIGALVDQRFLIETAKDSAVAGDSRRGSCRLTYRVVYTTAAGDPTVKL